MQEISKIEFSLMSMMDDFGRVFFADGKVYRAIQENKKEYCLSLLHSELFKELGNKKLIPETTIADFHLNGHSLVLEHEKILHTLQHEWTFSMIRNAALTILEVNEICNKYDYQLKDAHLFNVLFRGTQPVWVDIGSITPEIEKDRNWGAYEEFLNAVVVPLLFWSDNKHFIAHKLLESVISGMATIPSQTLMESGLMELLHLHRGPYHFKLRSKTLFSTKKKVNSLNTITQKSKSTVKKHLKRNTQIFSYNSNSEKAKKLSELIPFESVKNLLENLPIPNRESVWQQYHQEFYRSDGKINYSKRFLRIKEIIKDEGNITSIIDLAGNEGYFSQLITESLNIERIILGDYDENAIDKAYNRFLERKEAKVHTVLLNFMFAPDLVGTTKRLRSDLAVALAVTHHLILTGSYTLPAIFERLQLYSNKYVMIEFMPLGLWSGEKEVAKVPEWYNVEWFRNTFENYFDIIFEESLEVNRILFFGKIRRQ